MTPLGPTKGNKKQDKKPSPRAMVDMMNADSEKSLRDRILLFVDQTWMMNSSGLWRSVNDKAFLRNMNALLELYCLQHNVETSTNYINEMRQTLMRLLQRPTLEEIPWDDHGLIPLANGLFDFNARETRPYQPLDYATFCNNVEFIEGAECPNFVEMVTDIFDGDTEQVDLLQEIVGCGLLTDAGREMRTTTLFVGESKTGKTQLLDCIMGLYAKDTISVSFDELERPHGTEQFLTNKPWRHDEMSDGRTWSPSSTIKQLLTGEPVSVNIKHGAQVSVRYRRPVFWGSNFDLQIKDETDAIVNRITIFRCEHDFSGQITGVYKKARAAGYKDAASMILATEKPGILNWALEGLARALERGYLEKTSKTRLAQEEVKEDVNYAYKFIKECCEVSEGSFVTTHDFFVSCVAFAQENAFLGDIKVTQAGVTRKVRHIKNVSPDKFRINGIPTNVFAGIKLNPIGLEYWKVGAGDNRHENIRHKLSGEAARVNRYGQK